MHEIVANAIDQFYRKKDYSTFNALSSRPFDLPQKLKSSLNHHRLIMHEEEERVSPSKKWCMHFKDYKQDSFIISYETTLTISKVAPLFYLSHKFSAVHESFNGLVFGDYDGQPYLAGQLALDNKIRGFLTKSGYHGLTLLELLEAVEGFTYSKINPHVFVNDLLFKDIYNICVYE